MATKSNSQRLIESRKRREEETKNSSSVSNSERARKRKYEREIGFDTFESDLSNVNTTLSSVVGGWQSQETMANARSAVESMYNRTTAYQNYTSKYAPDAKSNVGELTNYYKSVLDNWDSLANAYGQYKDADSYTKETAKLKELASMTRDELASHLEDKDPIAYTTYGGQDITWKSLHDEKEHAELSTSSKGKQGWEKYLADELTASQEQKEKEANKKWYDYVLENYNTYDTTTPGGMLAQTVADKRKDTSYMKPTEEWSREEKNIFGAYYLEDTEKAYEYATNLNNAKNLAKKNEQKQAVSDSATSGFWAGAGHTLGSIASAPFALADFLDDVTDMAAGRPIIEESIISPFEYSQAVKGGISSELNDMSGTISEKVPIIGGKGLGDLYGVGTGVLQSAASAYTLGGAGTMVSYFGQGASEGIDDAISRGATDEQALLYGVIVGAGEGISEKIGVDNMFKLGSADTVKGFITNVLKQAGSEGIEEGVSSVISEVADRFVMQDMSVYENAVRTYMSQGMSEEEAKKQAGKDTFNSIAWDVVAGSLSGGIHGGVQTSVQSVNENAYNKSVGSAVRENETMGDLKNVASGLGDSYQKYVDLIESGTISDAKLGKLYNAVESDTINNYKTERANDVMRVVANRANELGDSKNSGIIASAIQKQNAGQKLSSEEKMALKSDTAQTILREGVGKDVGITETSMDALKRFGQVDSIITPKTVEEKAVRSATETAKQQAQENQTKVAEMVQAEGREDISFYTESMEQAKADAFNEIYDGKTDYESYANSFELAYTYGKSKIGVSEALRNRGVLTEAQALKAYEAGNLGRAIEKQKIVDDINKKYAGKTFLKGKFNDSIIDYNGNAEGKVAWKDLTEKQKKAVNFAKAFSEVTGVNISFITSKVVNAETGKRSGENGRYEASTNTIYIDVYAGIDAGVVEDSIVPVLSHEMTHWMKEKSPAMYQKMQDYILETLAVGGKKTMNDLIAVEKYRIRKNHPDQKVTDDDAIEELVARTCEDMLANSNNARKMLAKMSKTEADSFVAKIKETVENIMNWVNDLLKQYQSNSKEAEVLRQYKERMKELSKMWDAALAEAIQTNQSMKQEGITDVENNHVQYSVRENLIGEDGNLYPVVVELNKKDFRKATRSAKDFANYIYNNLLHQKIEVFDKDGNAEIIEFAKKNEYVKKDGVNNHHKVIDKLTQERNSDKKLVIINLPEVIKNSEYLAENSEHTHQWLDEKGWEIRQCFVTKRNGDEIYPVILTVGRTRDGRNVLYSANIKINEGVAIDKVATSEFAKKQTQQAVKIATPSNNESVAQADEDVNKEKFADREITTITEDEYTEAKEFFGTTKNYNVAGYMLKDGAMLDFSGRHWGNPSSDSRDVDHRDIWDVWEHDERDGTDEMVNMIGNGNIRLMPETGGINLALRPTEQQVEMLKKYINHFRGEIVVDIDKVGGDTVESFTYDKGTSAEKILDDIDNYFRGGRQSDLMRFHTMFSDRDSAGNTLTEEQQEYFKDSKVRDAEGNLLVMYHGTPNAGFTKFKSGTYFTEHKWYADVYQSPSASSISIKKSADNPDTYAVYLNMTKPFDTRNKAERDIFYNEYYRQWGTGTDLMESGLPDWVDGMDLQEFIEENGYDYDGIILDEGGVGGYGDEVTSRGLSYVIFNPKQVKNIDNTNPTSDPDIRYSDRDNVSVYELMGEKEQLLKQNAELQADVARLKERLKLEKKITNGNTFDEKKLEGVARYLLRTSNSNYSMDMLVDGLRDVYSYIVESEQLDWDDVFAKSYDVAKSVLADQREQKVENEYYKMVLSDIRNTRIKLSEQQIAEAKHIFGDNYHKSFFGRITLSQNGIDLDSKWQEWSMMYPEIFDAETTPADQITALYDIYDSVRDSAIMYQKFNDEENIRALATEIYNQYWNVSTIRTMADKHDKEIKRLNFEHRSAMKRMRDSYNENLEKQRLADRMHYGKIVNDIRNRKEAEVQKAKELGKKRAEAIRERAEAKALIQRITKNALTMNEWFVKNNKDKHIPEDMKGAVVQLIDAIDFSSKQMLGEGSNAYNPTNKDLRLARALSRLYEVADEMNGNRTEEAVFMELDIPDSAVELLKNLSKKSLVLNQMNTEELKALDVLVSTFKKAIVTANKNFVIAQNQTREQISNLLITDADSLSEKKADNAATNFFEYQNATPYYMLKRLGTVGEQIFNVLMDAQEQLVFLEEEIIGFVENTVSGEKIKQWSEEIHEIKILDAKHSTEDNPKYKTLKMTTAQIMSLYALEKRESAKLHLEGGGIRMTDIKDGAFKTIKDTVGASLAKDELYGIIGKLTDEQKKVADALQKFMSETGAEWGNKVTMARWDIKQFGEPNYFPMATVAQDGNLDNVGNKDNSIYRLLNMSFTKELTPRANNQLIIDNIFDVFSGHMTDMAKYTTHALPLLDAMKILGYSRKDFHVDEDGKKSVRHETISVAKSIRRAFGDNGYRYIINLLKDLNGVETTPRDENISKTLMANYKISAVGGNLRVALLQGTAFIKAGLVLDSKYLTKALVTNGLEGSKKAMKHSGIALWKSKGHYDLNISRSVAQEIKQDKNWMDNVREWSLKGAEWGDKITWGYLWNACELWAKDNTTYSYNSEEFNKAVADKLREVIVKTQVVDSTLTRSQMMRDKSAMVQTLTAFMSESTMTYNMLSDMFFEWSLDARKGGNTYKNTFSKHGRKFAKTVGVYTMTAFATALAGAFVDAMRDDDEEKEFDEKYLENLLESLGDNLNIFTNLPIVKDIFSIAQGFSPSRFDEQSFTNLFSGMRKWVKVFEGEGNVYSATYKTLQGMSQLSGLPVSNMMRDAVAMWNSTIGEMYPHLKIEQ